MAVLPYKSETRRVSEILIPALIPVKSFLPRLTPQF